MRGCAAAQQPVRLVDDQAVRPVAQPVQDRLQLECGARGDDHEGVAGRGLRGGPLRPRHRTVVAEQGDPAAAAAQLEHGVAHEGAVGREPHDGHCTHVNRAGARDSLAEPARRTHEEREPRVRGPQAQRPILAFNLPLAERVRLERVGVGERRREPHGQRALEVVDAPPRLGEQGVELDLPDREGIAVDAVGHLGVADDARVDRECVRPEPLAELLLQEDRPAHGLLNYATADLLCGPVLDLDSVELEACVRGTNHVQGPHIASVLVPVRAAVVHEPPDMVPDIRVHGAAALHGDGILEGEPCFLWAELGHPHGLPCILVAPGRLHAPHELALALPVAEGIESRALGHGIALAEPRGRVPHDAALPLTGTVKKTRGRPAGSVGGSLHFFRELGIRECKDGLLGALPSKDRSRELGDQLLGV